MKTLDADKYRLNIKTIKLFLDDKTANQRLELIGRLALMTNVPIIIIAVYIGELYGITEALTNRIAKLKQFYQVNEILNIKVD
jgi:hypothetical protein